MHCRSMPRPALESSPFGAIAHPTRRAVLDLLRQGDRSVGELRAQLGPTLSGPSQPAFSEHLSVLARAGLVRARPRGRERVYALRAAPLAEAYDWLKDYEAFWDDRLARFGAYLDRKTEEPS
jgi:DNA-binding transcriptional ArsR family regulator